MEKSIRWLVLITILCAVALNAYGGYRDIYTSGGLTKDHAWQDAVFLLLLAIAGMLFSRS